MSLLVGFKLWHVGGIIAPILGAGAAWYDLKTEVAIHQERLSEMSEHVQKSAAASIALRKEFIEFRVRDEAREALNADINERFREVEREAHTH